MSKAQINYLLALATLFIVWLFFNTFYTHPKKGPGGMPFGGMNPSFHMQTPGFPPFPGNQQSPNRGNPQQDPRGSSFPGMPKPGMQNDGGQNR